MVKADFKKLTVPVAVSAIFAIAYLFIDQFGKNCPPSVISSLLLMIATLIAAILGLEVQQRPQNGRQRNADFPRPSQFVWYVILGVVLQVFVLCVCGDDCGFAKITEKSAVCSLSGGANRLLTIGFGLWVFVFLATLLRQTFKQMPASGEAD